MSQEHPRPVADRTRRDQLDDLIGRATEIYGSFGLLEQISVWTFAAAVLVAIFAPVLAPNDPSFQNYSALLAPPATKGYLLGTDIYGRDVLSRLIYGARVSLMVAIGGVSIAVVLGCSIGSVAGWTGGMIDEGMMRLTDVMFSFPSLVLALALVAVFGPSITTLILVIGIVYSPQYARLIRSTVLSEKEEPYVEAARNTGLRSRRVLLNHVIPNSFSPVIVQASFHMAWAMLLEASLSFLGLGVQPPNSSWGIMIANGRSEMPEAWWLMTFPGIAIIIVVLSFNFMGDGLRDELDPHSQTDSTTE